MRGNYHAATVPPPLLWGTTVAMANTPPDEAELEHLLTQLLRMVSPAFGADSSVLAYRAGRAAAEGRNAGAAATRPAPAFAADHLASAAVVPQPADGGSATSTVSASEARALIELVAAGGIAQGELAGLLGLDKSTVSRLAASLERKGWVRRGRDEGNQRYVRLYLTSEGGEVAARVWQAWKSRRARILAALSDDERAGLTAGLRGLIRGLAAEHLLDDRAGSRGAGFR